MNTCSGCDARWSAVTEAHCFACHRHFAHVSGFDLHGPSRRRCGNPALLGLVEIDGVWATSDEHQSRAERAERMRSMRHSRGRTQTQTDEHVPPRVEVPETEEAGVNY